MATRVERSVRAHLPTAATTRVASDTGAMTTVAAVVVREISAGTTEDGVAIAAEDAAVGTKRAEGEGFAADVGAEGVAIETFLLGCLLAD